jgi:hypothetical protein
MEVRRNKACLIIIYRIVCMTWLTYHLLFTYSSHNYTGLVTTPLSSWCHIPEHGVQELIPPTSH